MSPPPYLKNQPPHLNDNSLHENDSYFLYPNEANKYKQKLQNSFQHGGISLEEMLIPVVRLKGIS